VNFDPFLLAGPAVAAFIVGVRETYGKRVSFFKGTLVGIEGNLGKTVKGEDMADCRVKPVADDPDVDPAFVHA